MNPLLLLYLIKNYFTDLKRLECSYEKLENYREHAFKRVLKRALQTPLYAEKYKSIDTANISLKTINRLPIVTKQDLRNHFPYGVTSKKLNASKAHLVSTSGSTGQPTSIYTDHYTIIKALIAFIRELRACNISWRDKLTLIVDLTPRAIEEAYLVKGLPIRLSNMQILHVGEDVEKLSEKINAFRPKFIGGYPGVLRALAVLKRKGHGNNIQPETIASSGAVLDDYTKRYIEEAFNARVFDVYGSTEGGPIAFECTKGNYHIHHDMVHLEFLDEHQQPVEYGTPGHIIITKLYGNATPIIRYNGLKDFVIPLSKKCDCTINTPLIEKIVGRRADALVMPSGKIIPPFSVTGIPSKVMEQFNSTLVQQFQIIQENQNEIYLYLVMENESDEKENIMNEIKKEFEKRVERGVKISVVETDEIKSKELIPRVIVSKAEIK